MQAVESGEESVWIFFHVIVVVFEDRPEEFVLCVMDRLDDEPIIAREVEEGARFPRRAKFREDVFRGQGEEIVCGVESEVLLSQFAENPRRIVLEFKVVSRGWRQFIPDTAKNHV